MRSSCNAGLSRQGADGIPQNWTSVVNLEDAHLMKHLERTTKVNQRLDKIISKNLPSLDRDEVETVRERIIEYVADGLADGYSLALVKEVDDESTVLKVLKLLSHERSE